MELYYTILIFTFNNVLSIRCMKLCIDLRIIAIVNITVLWDSGLSQKEQTCGQSCLVHISLLPRSNGESWWRMVHFLDQNCLN